MQQLAARVATVVVAVFLVAHGLVHLMGVALLWKLGQPGDLTYDDAVPTPGTPAAFLVGGLWLFAGGLLVAAAWLLVLRKPRWGWVAVSGALLSGVVIGLNAGEAVAGLVADVLVLLLVAGCWLYARRTGSLLRGRASA